MKFLQSLVAICLLLCLMQVNATTDKYRIMWKTDPATSMVIGWNQVSGSNPIVHYDSVDHGTNSAAYANQQTPDRVVNYFSMNNHFVRLTGLQANTAYYFVISDTDGTSNRYWFKTAPDVNTERLSIIAGSDSRSNRTPRQNANLLVSKLRPHCVVFGGDMTSSDNDSQWQEWMDDWQLTIGADGRIIPFVAARGNHELSNTSIYNMFDTPTENIVYALNFAGDLLRVYTLNSEIVIGGNQAKWLRNDLAANTNMQWKIAQYHRPTRPHTSGKLPMDLQYEHWASTFYDFGVNLVIEGDAHTVKTTWPLKPSNEAGNQEGFVRDDCTGTVYTGEGCWGAPLRSNDDDKSWTRASGEFNQFKWIFIDQDRMEIRTIQVDNASSVGTVNDADIFTAPANLNIWNAPNGQVVTIDNYTNQKPTVELTSPRDEALYTNTNTIELKANVSDPDGSIAYVEYYVNDQLISVVPNAPYNYTYTSSTQGNQTIKAIAVDDTGICGVSEPADIAFTYRSDLYTVQSANDDAEEAGGSVSLSSDDLDLGDDDYVGVRFQTIKVPQGATIRSAYMEFFVNATNLPLSGIDIEGEAADDSAPFVTSSNNISSRPRTSADVGWSPTWLIPGFPVESPDLKNIIQEIIGRPGWVEGNALSLIVTGGFLSGREAGSFEGGAAPTLYIEYDFSGFTPPNLGPDQTLCIGDIALLDAGVGFTSYKWNDDPLLNLQTVSAIAPNSFIVEATYDQCQNAIAVDDITINTFPDPPVDLGPDLNIPCPDGTPVMVNAGTGYSSYQWSNGNTNNAISALNSGLYTVTAIDVNGCESIDDIQVNLGLEIQLAPIAYSVLVPINIEYYQINVVGGTAPYNAVWNNTGMVYNISTGINNDAFKVVMRRESVLDLTITDANGCVSHLNTGYVGGHLGISQHAVQEETTSGAADGSVDITVSGGVPTYNILWSTGATTEDISGLASGWYGVTVTDQSGDEVHDWYWVPRGYDGRSKTGGSAISDQDGFAELAFYPNPANQFTNVEYSYISTENTSDLMLSVYSPEGKLMEQKTVSSLHGSLSLDTSAWPNGIYMVELNEENNKRVILKKLVVFHNK